MKVITIIQNLADQYCDVKKLDRKALIFVTRYFKRLYGSLLESDHSKIFSDTLEYMDKLQSLAVKNEVSDFIYQLRAMSVPVLKGLQTNPCLPVDHSLSVCCNTVSVGTIVDAISIRLILNLKLYFEVDHMSKKYFQSLK